MNRYRKQFELTYTFGEKQWVRELDDETYIEKVTRESQKAVNNKGLTIGEFLDGAYDWQENV